MFQPTVTRDVGRAIQQRINAVQRNVQDDMSREELETSRTMLLQISNNIASLQPVISEELWVRLDGDCGTLLQVIGSRLLASVHANTDVSSGTEVRGSDDESSPDDNSQVNNVHTSVGRPKVGINKEKLRILLDMDFTASETARKSLLGFKTHRNTILNFMKTENMVT